MKLKASEKVLVFILTIGVIGGLGYYLLINPNLNKMLETDDKIEATKVLIAEAKQAEIDNVSISMEYSKAKLLPLEIQKIFYDEDRMKISTEAEKTISHILDRSGHVSVTGKTVYPIQPVSLTVRQPPEVEDISYGMRQYSFLQQLGESGEIETETTETGETGISLREAMRYLLDTHGKKDPSITRQMAEIVRSKLYDTGTEVAVVKADFTLKLSTREYNEFLEYINSLPRLTALTTAEFRHAERGSAEREEYEFTLNLYCIKEMQTVEDLEL